MLSYLFIAKYGRIAKQRSASTLKFLFLFFLLTILCGLTLSAQSVSVKGTVVNESGVPMAGVSVSEKGTTNGTISNGSGNFSITVASSASVLVFSYSGYITGFTPPNPDELPAIRAQLGYRDDELVCVDPSPGAQRGEVGTRAGFREALAPDDVAPQDPS